MKIALLPQGRKHPNQPVTPHLLSSPNGSDLNPLHVLQKQQCKGRYYCTCLQKMNTGDNNDIINLVLVFNCFVSFS